MQKKVAILINEGLLEMRLGVNTSLSYIAAAIELGNQISIINIENQDPLQETLHALNLPQGCQQDLISEFKTENKLYFSEPDAATRTFADLGLQLIKGRVKMSDFDLVLQRLDPVNRPFPPFGEQDIDKLLLDFVNFHQIQNQNFNLPIDCFKDKDFAQNIDEKIAITTKEADSAEILVDNIMEFVSQGYNKLVIKPDNLGQSKGVFAINFTEDGLDLKDFSALEIAKIQDLQIYNIKKDRADIGEIILNLLFCESLKERGQRLKKTAADFTRDEKLEQISMLYSSKILLQPFIEGVVKGDIRVNIAKVEGQFCLLGKVFRKPDFANFEESFTTCVTSNAARAVAVEEVLSDQEEKDLGEKIELVLQSLNGRFARKYDKCNEIGLDFIVKGDGNSVLLNEANHYCPALITLSENVDKMLSEKRDGGLFLAKKLIKNWIN